MRIEITGQQIDVTQALREYVQAKFERLGRHFEPLLDVPSPAASDTRLTLRLIPSVPFVLVNMAAGMVGGCDEASDRHATIRDHHSLARSGALDVRLQVRPKVADRHVHALQPITSCTDQRVYLYRFVSRSSNPSVVNSEGPCSSGSRSASLAAASRP